MIYRFQEFCTAARMIEHEADNYDEAYEKWVNGDTPLNESDWVLGDDHEIFLDGFSESD